MGTSSILRNIRHGFPPQGLGATILCGMPSCCLSNVTRKYARRAFGKDKYGRKEDAKIREKKEDKEWNGIVTVKAPKRK